MKFSITHRFTAAVLFEAEIPDDTDEALRARVALEFAARASANLYGANLYGADLKGADLKGADLKGADLEGANLKGADLEGANLKGANLKGADLKGADLEGANLEGANLYGADLKGADLEGANLKGANLKGADLEGADLEGADLQPIRDDFWAVLSSAPAEVPALIDALKQGRVDGSTYHGDCACLVGTIANARGVDVDDLGVLKPMANRPAERFFFAIKRGDTPDTNHVSKIATEWAEQWLATMRAGFASSTTEVDADALGVLQKHAGLKE